MSQNKTTNQQEDIDKGAAWRETLGKQTWFFLHTLAAKYPDKPSEVDMRTMRNLVAGLGQHYPCKLCRAHLKVFFYPFFLNVKYPCLLTPNSYRIFWRDLWRDSYMYMQISSQISSFWSNLVSCLRYDETRFDNCDEICDELSIFDFDLDFDFSNLVNQISSSGNNWV